MSANSDSLLTLIDKAIHINAGISSLQSVTGPAEVKTDRIPTLEPDCYRAITPMLDVRFGMFSYWRNATHGDWLSVSEMKSLWSDKKDDYIQRIADNVKAAADNWANDAYGLFLPKRLSLFAGSPDILERIYLLWLDNADEPELLVYDCNGMARYKDLEEYLTAYINDDLSRYNN